MSGVDLLTIAKTMLAAASTARGETPETVRSYYVGSARVAIVEIRAELAQLEKHLAALEAEIARTSAPRGQLEIGEPR